MSKSKIIEEYTKESANFGSTRRLFLGEDGQEDHEEIRKFME